VAMSSPTRRRGIRCTRYGSYLEDQGYRQLGQRGDEVEDAISSDSQFSQSTRASNFSSRCKNKGENTNIDRSQDNVIKSPTLYPSGFECQLIICHCGKPERQRSVNDFCSCILGNISVALWQ